MLRKFTHYLLILTIWFSVVRCDDEVSTPPKPQLSVDTNTGLMEDYEFKFTIQQSGADAVSLYPYGTKEPGILIEKSQFVNGQAVVSFRYGKAGEFEAVARANNHSRDGENRNNDSNPVSMIITSDDSQFTAFGFENSTDTKIDQVTGAIEVTVPYNTDVTALKAVFTASPFSTVTVEEQEQKSEETVNNFTDPVTYVVTSHNKQNTKSYTVTVDVTDADVRTSLKEVKATAARKSANAKSLGVSVDNTNHIIVVYDTLGSTQLFDSVKVSYETDSKFAVVNFGGKKLPQEKLLDLRNPQEFVVSPQDSAAGNPKITYNVYATDAPKIKQLSFTNLVPVVTGKPTDFTFDINVIQGTDRTSLDTKVELETLPAGVTVSHVNGTPIGGSEITLPNVNYSQPFSLKLTVVDTRLSGGTTYTVEYIVNVAVVR